MSQNKSINWAAILGAVLEVLSRKKLGSDFVMKEKNKNVFSARDLFQILRVLFLYKYISCIR